MDDKFSLPPIKMFGLSAANSAALFHIELINEFIFVYLLSLSFYSFMEHCLRLNIYHE